MAIDSVLFEKLDHVNTLLYEVELAKAQSEHIESMIFGFFLLQYAKVRECWSCTTTSSTDFVMEKKFEELQRDTE